MALNKELKSSMTGEPAPKSDMPEEPKAPVEPVSPEPARETTPDPVIPDPVIPPVPPTDPQPAGDMAEVLSALKSVEKQLRTLNQSVADMESEIDTFKNPDYHVILSRIDTTRAALEKLLTPAAAPDPGVSAEQMQKLEDMIRTLAEKQDKNDRQLTQTLRENANFQVQVRQGMQRDLDDLKEKVEGEQFNPLLKAVAEVYSEYYSIQSEECLTDRARKNLRSLFGQLEDLLMEYDAEPCVTSVGSVRKNRVSKVVGKIPTGDKEKHNTVALSRMPGVVRNQMVLHQEFVDIYIFDPELQPPEPEVTEEETAAAPEEPVAVEATGEVETIPEPGNPETPAPAEEQAAPENE